MKKNRELPESELRQNTQANEVLVWGSNLKGQLGVGENLQGLNFTKVKFPFLTLKPKLCLFQISLKSVSCGYEHTILLTNSNHVYTMGSNLKGQLGIKTESVRGLSTPKLVEELKKQSIVRIEAGAFHSLAINTSGDVFTWGNGDSGQLGLGENGNFPSPKKVNFLENSGLKSKFGEKMKVVDASCGLNHTMFVVDNGSVFCTGDNKFGQLGVTGIMRSNRPILNEFIRERIKEVACGTNFTIFLKENGSLLSCGSNAQGQLGVKNLSRKYLNIPIQVNEIKNRVIEKISAGDFPSCITSQGEFLIWGVPSLTKFINGKKKSVVKYELKSGVKELKIKGKNAVLLDKNCKIWKLNIHGNDGKSLQVSSVEGRKVKSLGVGFNFTVAICEDFNGDFITKNFIHQENKIEKKIPEKKKFNEENTNSTNIRNNVNFEAKIYDDDDDLFINSSDFNSIPKNTEETETPYRQRLEYSSENSEKIPNLRIEKTEDLVEESPFNNLKNIEPEEIMPMTAKSYTVDQNPSMLRGPSRYSKFPPKASNRMRIRSPRTPKIQDLQYRISIMEQQLLILNKENQLLRNELKEKNNSEEDSKDQIITECELLAQELETTVALKEKVQDELNSKQIEFSEMKLRLEKRIHQLEFQIKDAQNILEEEIQKNSEVECYKEKLVEKFSKIENQEKLKNSNLLSEIQNLEQRIEEFEAEKEALLNDSENLYQQIEDQNTQIRERDSYIETLEKQIKEYIIEREKCEIEMDNYLVIIREKDDEIEELKQRLQSQHKKIKQGKLKLLHQIKNSRILKRESDEAELPPRRSYWSNNPYKCHNSPHRCVGSGEKLSLSCVNISSNGQKIPLNNAPKFTKRRKFHRSLDKLKKIIDETRVIGNARNSKFSDFYGLDETVNKGVLDPTTQKSYALFGNERFKDKKKEFHKRARNLRKIFNDNGKENHNMQNRGNNRNRINLLNSGVYDLEHDVEYHEEVERKKEELKLSEKNLDMSLKKAKNRKAELKEKIKQFEERIKNYGGVSSIIN